MPKPLKSGAVVDYPGVEHIYGTSPLMRHIGIIACLAAKLEVRLLHLFALVMRKDAQTASLIYDEIVNQNIKFQVLCRFAKDCLPEDMYKELIEKIKKKLSTASKARTQAVHTNWLISHQHEAALISGNLHHPYTLEKYKEHNFMLFYEQDFEDMQTKVEDALMDLEDFLARASKILTNPFPQSPP